MSETGDADDANSGEAARLAAIHQFMGGTVIDPTVATLDELADELLAGATEREPEIMSSKCYGGGGATTGSSPGCDDIAEADDVAT